MKNLGLAIILCTIIIGFLILYERKKWDHKRDEAEKAFWAKENAANNVRRKDITFLNYIEIPLDSLPFIDTDDEELLSYHKIIRSLSDKRILNLTGISNTDLKLEYGPANLPDLSAYDDNYTTLVNTLAKWGARLIALNKQTEAVTVLEYGITIGTDVSRNYYLLADIYRRMNRPDEIDRLIKAAEGINTMMKPSIIKKLTEIKGYCS
ncbi:MAG: hypothetical protein ACI4EW_06335 [Butyrivibrio sp.]